MVFHTSFAGTEKSLSVYVKGVHSEFVHMLTNVDVVLAVSVILLELTSANSLLSPSFLYKPVWCQAFRWWKLVRSGTLFVLECGKGPWRLEAMWLKEVPAVFSADVRGTTHLILVNRETHWTAPTGRIKFKLIMILCAFTKSWRTCLCYQFTQ